MRETIILEYYLLGHIALGTPPPTIIINYSNPLVAAHGNNVLPLSCLSRLRREIKFWYKQIALHRVAI